MEITETTEIIENPIIIRDRLNPLVPIVSVVINFTMDENTLPEENLKKLDETITSILMQDYVNLEIIVVGECCFWQEYVQVATEAKLYGEVVKYIHLGYEGLKKNVNGGYILLMNVGEYLIHSGYLTATLKIMLTHRDIGITFANYSLIDSPNRTIREGDGLSFIGNLSANSWTKIDGKKLFFNYDQLWCMPGTTVFRLKIFINYIDNNIKKINKLLFLRMLLETNAAFHNDMVAGCCDGFDKGNRKFTLSNCDASLEYIELATIDALIAGCEKSDVQNWRTTIIKKYFSDIVNSVDGNGILLNGLYDIAKKFGVMKLLHETIMQMAGNKK